MIKPKVKKAKVKERSSDEYYRAQIRGLEKECRALRKQLKQYEKMEHNLHKEDLGPDENDDSDHPVKCMSCGKGVLNSFTIGPRVISTCSVCGVRKTVRLDK